MKIRPSKGDRLFAAPPHLIQIYAASMFHGVTLGFLYHGTKPLPGERPSTPWIAIIGDDTDCALGPDGFHPRTISRLLAQADSAVLVACAPLPALYETAALLAIVLRRNVVLIETRPEHELTWSALILDKRPDLPVLVGTTTVGRA